MKNDLEPFKKALLSINDIKEESQLVQLFELILSKVTIGTIQQIADLEGKSYNGIKKSERYAKIEINGKKLVVKGVENTKFPF
tara:strand:+ start:2310 stop:2558 length:249 start_codon:yes stop_codon:yes gene_type:complete